MSVWVSAQAPHPDRRVADQKHVTAVTQESVLCHRPEDVARPSFSVSPSGCGFVIARTSRPIVAEPAPFRAWCRKGVSTDAASDRFVVRRQDLDCMVEESGRPCMINCDCCPITCRGYQLQPVRPLPAALSKHGGVHQQLSLISVLNRAIISPDPPRLLVGDDQIVPIKPDAVGLAPDQTRPRLQEHLDTPKWRRGRPTCLGSPGHRHGPCHGSSSPQAVVADLGTHGHPYSRKPVLAKIIV